MTIEISYFFRMENIEDDYFTNLSWLNSSELSATGDSVNNFLTNLFCYKLVDCSNNHIDDDLQCLCWLVQIRPTLSSFHSLKVK